MSALGVPFERKVAPFRRGPCPSVVTLVGFPMALLLPCCSMIRKYLIPRESATPHTNAVFFCECLLPNPSGPVPRTSQNSVQKKFNFRESTFRDCPKSL